MGAISAFSTAVETLKRNRVLIAAVFVFTLLNFLLTGVTALFPPETAGLASLPLSGLTLLVTPFFIGGLLALAYEGLDGVTRFETFVDGGKAHYLRLLGSMVLFGVLFSVVAVAVVLAVAVVAVFVIGTNLSDAGSSLAMSGGGFAVIAVAGLIGLVVLLVPTFFLQFYAPAIVVSDLGIVDAFKRSAGLVRRNLVSTLGYTTIAAAIGVLAGIAGVAASILGEIYAAPGATGTAFPEVGLGAFAAVMVAVVVVTTLVSAFGVTYQVAFYDDRLDSLA